jgi:hypothetical protein
MSTIPVPYVFLGGYAAFVVISSLLVGILPPLVNLPPCDDSKEYIINVENSRVAPAAHDELPIKVDLPKESQVDSNSKHSKKSKRDTSKNVLERTNTFKESHSDFFALRNNLKNAYPNLTICSELVNPVPGVRYPWYESRLPNNIAPVNYNVELFVPAWTSDIYDGEIDITFTVNSSTNYLLLHSKLELPFLEGKKNIDISF